MIKKKSNETNTEYVRRLIERDVFPNSIKGVKRLSKSKVEIAGYRKEGNK